MKKIILYLLITVILTIMLIFQVNAKPIIILAVIVCLVIIIAKVVLHLQQTKSFNKIKDPEERLIWLDKNRTGWGKVSETFYWNRRAAAYFEMCEYEKALECNEKFYQTATASDGKKKSSSSLTSTGIYLNNCCVYLDNMELFDEMEVYLNQLKEHMEVKSHPVLQSTYYYCLCELEVYRGNPAAGKLALEEYKKFKDIPDVELSSQLLEAKLLWLEGENDSACVTLRKVLNSDRELSDFHRRKFETMLEQIEGRSLI